MDFGKLHILATLVRSPEEFLITCKTSNPFLEIVGLHRDADRSLEPSQLLAL